MVPSTGSMSRYDCTISDSGKSNIKRETGIEPVTIRAALESSTLSDPRADGTIHVTHTKNTTKHHTPQTHPPRLIRPVVCFTSLFLYCQCISARLHSFFYFLYLQTSNVDGSSTLLVPPNEGSANQTRLFKSAANRYLLTSGSYYRVIRQ